MGCRSKVCQIPSLGHLVGLAFIFDLMECLVVEFFWLYSGFVRLLTSGIFPKGYGTRAFG
jgi:hypothetical protein